MQTSLLPAAVISQLGYFSLDEKINGFKGVTLYELVKSKTNMRFPSEMTKYSYRMEYSNLQFSVFEARDNFSKPIVPAHSTAYTKQHMHSISGETSDLCYYTMSPKQLVDFLEMNKTNKFTYLPVTIHAIDSANGFRHDMLLVFNNNSKLFWLFDCRNRSDFLPKSANYPKDALDVFFVEFSTVLKFGYHYEPTESWQFPGTFQPYGNIGDLDFILSTAWCYNLMISLQYFDSPVEYLTVLDNMSLCNRFNLVYLSMLCVLDMPNLQHNKHVPLRSQQDLVDLSLREAVPSYRVAEDNQSKKPEQNILPTVIQTKQVNNSNNSNNTTTFDMSRSSNIGQPVVNRTLPENQQSNNGNTGNNFNSFNKNLTSQNTNQRTYRRRHHHKSQKDVRGVENTTEVQNEIDLSTDNRYAPLADATNLSQKRCSLM